MSSRFVWRGPANDITSWAKSCLDCQRSKVHRHAHLLPQPIGGFLISTLTWWALYNTYSSGCNHIFTIIDRTSKWMEALPLSETSAAACTRALIFSWMTSFGVPETITSDRGSQFSSNIWSQLCDTVCYT